MIIPLNNFAVATYPKSQDYFEGSEDSSKSPPARLKNGTSKESDAKDDKSESRTSTTTVDDTFTESGDTSTDDDATSTVPSQNMRDSSYHMQKVDEARNPLKKYYQGKFAP